MKNLGKIILICLVIIFFVACSKEGGIASPVKELNANETDSTVTWMGKIYHKVKIGDQVWMKENLDVGKAIPAAQLQSDNRVIEKYYFLDDSVHFGKFGGLYQWGEAMQYVNTEGAQGIAPPGWHIPTLEDFRKLLAYVEFDTNSLKAIGVGTGAGTGTNTTGFSGLLGGWRGSTQEWGWGERQACFWSSSLWSLYEAYNLQLTYETNYSNVIHYRSYTDQIAVSGCFHIRCIKDKP